MTAKRKPADPAGVNGLGREAPPTLPTIPDVEVPTDAEGYAKMVTKGIARALECTVSAKELVDAVKAATEWYKVRYVANEDDDLGAGLDAARRNGHG